MTTCISSDMQEHINSSDKMELPHEYTCKQWCSACTYMRDVYQGGRRTESASPVQSHTVC